MLPRYQENFAALSKEETTMVACAIAKRHPGTIGPMGMCAPSGDALFDACESSGLSQAQVVLALAPNPSAEATVALEKLVGRPIVRYVTPVRSTPAPRSHTAAVSAARGAAMKKSDPRKISWVQDANPKKPGSAAHHKFGLYRVGMSVSEFIEAGGTIADVKWDTERGFVKLEDMQ